MSLSVEQQRALVLEQLERHDEIVAKTKERIDEVRAQGPEDPLAGVTDDVRRQVEEEYYARQGRSRYTASDGRTLWLTEEQIAKRKRAKARRKQRGSSYYGPAVADKRRLVSLAFNLAAILLGLAIVYVIIS